MVSIYMEWKVGSYLGVGNLEVGRKILFWEGGRVSEKPRFVAVVLVPGRPKVSSVSFKLQSTACDSEDIVCVLSNSDTRRRRSINFNVQKTGKRWSCTCLSLFAAMTKSFLLSLWLQRLRRSSGIFFGNVRAYIMLRMTCEVVGPSN